MTTPLAANRSAAGARMTRHAAAWLGLAASPTFALIALVAAAEAQRMTMSASMSSILPIDGMVLMYLLMSLFHLSPWLKLVPHWRRQHNDPTTQTEGD